MDKLDFREGLHFANAREQIANRMVCSFGKVDVGKVRAGNCVVMTTHILEIAERMADRIGVISNGRLVAEGTLAELRDRTGSGQASLEDMFLAIVEQDRAAE